MAEAAPAPDQPAAPPPVTEGAFTSGRRAAMVQALTGAGAPAPEPTPTPTPTPEPAPPPEQPKPAPEPAPDEAAALRKQEIHLKRQIAEERKKALDELAAERAAFAAEKEEAARIKAMTGNAKKDRIAAIKALGFTDSDLAALGTELYAASPEGQKDPRYAQQAAAKRAERDELSKYDQEIAETKREMAEFKAWKQQQEQQAQAQQAQQRIDTYLDTVAAAATDATPLTKTALAKDPARTRNALAQIAEQLYIASGPADDLRDVPTHAEVIKAYEKMRAEELAMFGIDPTTIGKPAPAPAPTNGAPRPSTTLAPGAGTPTQTTTPGRKSRAELIKEVQRIAAIAKP